MLKKFNIYMEVIGMNFYLMLISRAYTSKTLKKEGKSY